MREKYTATVGLATLPAERCTFGLCHAAPTHVVTTRTAIGGRVELLCAAHARRRHQLEQVLNDDRIPPIPAPCGLADDHEGPCQPSTTSPDQSEPILGSLPTPRCTGQRDWSAA